MNEKLAEYILKEIVHTQAHFLALKSRIKTFDEIPVTEDEILAYSEGVATGMKGRAAHLGVSLEGLLP